MSRYRVTHRTEYVYAESVPLCHNAVHLQPRDTQRQKAYDAQIAITPQPAVRTDRRDFFGNFVTHFAIQEPHRRLAILSTSEVDVEPTVIPTQVKALLWDDLARQMIRPTTPDLIDASQFIYDSPQVARDPLLAGYAKPGFPAGKPLVEAVGDLMLRIHDEFTFDTTATTIGTPVLDVLKHRHGVCQDFAHLMIGCLRSMGLPARYVSGYLLTSPAPGKPRLVGTDASHAWVSVYFPDHGWIEFDPTNGLIVSDQHVTLATARDYDDVCPVKGVIIGGRNHRLHVSVDVEPL